MSTKEIKYEKNTSLFFTDDKRRIDYILRTNVELQQSSDFTLKLNVKNEFESKCKLKGIDIEYDGDDNDGNFIKLHITNKALLDGAEMVKMHKRIKNRNDCAGIPVTTRRLLKLPKFTGFPPLEKNNPYSDDQDYFTAPFNKLYMDEFEIDAENPSNSFTNAERSLITYTLLSTLNVEYEGRTYRGLKEMIKLGIYLDGFPLHESLKVKEGEDNLRYKLRINWARWDRILTYQPMDMIRDYFGEKIGIYFAWLGYYTTMLVPVSIIGFLCFVYGLATFNDQKPVMDICNKTGVGSLVLCPNCDNLCTFTNLWHSCLYSKLSYIFDNNSTIVFAFIMAVWSTVFLELWKRHEKRLQYDWDVFNFEEEEETRPEFIAKRNECVKKEDEYQPFIPWYINAPRRCMSISTVLFMITLVLAAIFGVIVYRIIIIAVFYSINSPMIKSNAKIITSITAAILNLIVIQLLGLFYKRLAIFLTNIEIPRTRSRYEDSFTLKMFLFQFVNYYGSIFYIAFFKGKFSTYPGDKSGYFLGRWRQDECDPSGCFVDLFIQLVIIMIGKQALNNFKELALPILMHIYKKHFQNALSSSSSSTDVEREENDDNKKKLKTRYQIDNSLQDPPANMFDEYLEMVIQFGFITIFVTAFPLAPIFALLNNLFEIRLDAIKFLCLMKRPLPFKASGIGIWYGIMKKLTYVAILSNGFIIAFTTEFIPRMVYSYKHGGVGGSSNLDGFIADRLGVFNVTDYEGDVGPDMDRWSIDGDKDAVKNLTFCHYPGYYSYNAHKPLWDNRYEKTNMYWTMMLARVSLVLIFEHLVFLITWIVGVLIPDIPADVKRMQVVEKEMWKAIIGFKFDGNLINDIQAGRNEMGDGMEMEMENIKT